MKRNHYITTKLLIQDRKQINYLGEKLLREKCIHRFVCLSRAYYPSCIRTAMKVMNHTGEIGIVLEPYSVAEYLIT